MNRIDNFKKKAVLAFLIFWVMTFVLNVCFILLPFKRLMMLALFTFLGACFFILFMYFYLKWQEKKETEGR
jgi:RsiW-degrading membrane proteinase PrsW (M82 family)